MFLHFISGGELAVDTELSIIGTDSLVMNVRSATISGTMQATFEINVNSSDGYNSEL